MKDTLKKQKGIEIMAKISKTVVDKELRDSIFDEIFELQTDAGRIDGFTLENGSVYHKVNDRQWGTIRTDANGVQRYCRIGVIVAEEREDMTAEELMQSEIDAYQAKQEAKAEKAKKKEEKIARDKARREQEKKKEEEEDKDDEHQYLPREVRE